MNELTHVSLSSPTLSGLDLVSSARALLKTQLGSFDPKQVPLSSEVDAKVTDIQSKAQLTRNEAKEAADEAKKVGVDLAKSGFLVSSLRWLLPVLRLACLSLPQYSRGGRGSLIDSLWRCFYLSGRRCGLCFC